MMKVHTILLGRLYQRGTLTRVNHDSACEALRNLNVQTVLVMTTAAHSPRLQRVVLDGYQLHDMPDGYLHADRRSDLLRLSEWAVARAQRGAILTVCYGGQNRSALMSGLILRKLTGCSGAEAIDAVRQGRRNALTNHHFCAFLRSLP